jgi:hypothetical protein
MQQLLTYGLSGGELQYIMEVSNGLSCNCVCPFCKESLVAKNNSRNVKTPHFAHQSTKECTGAIETALHLLAKSILQKNKQMMLPNFHHDYNHFNRKSFYKKGRTIKFENILLEKVIEFEGSKIVPDAIAEINNKQVFIEFANTHFVDDEKKAILKSLQVACIEIDLNEQLLDEASLTTFLTSISPSIYWINNPRFNKEYDSYKKTKLENKKIEAAKKAIETENERKKEEIKYNRYKNGENGKLLVVKNDEVDCRLKKDAFKILKSSRYYQHPILKKIIDGADWNCIIYGWIPNGKYIYFQNKKEIVFLPDKVYKNLNKQQINDGKLFYHGLCEIKTIVENSEYGQCSSCKFSVNHFSFREISYEVCGHE